MTGVTTGKTKGRYAIFNKNCNFAYSLHLQALFEFHSFKIRKLVLSMTRYSENKYFFSFKFSFHQLSDTKQLPFVDSQHLKEFFQRYTHLPRQSFRRAHSSLRGTVTIYNRAERINKIRVWNMDSEPSGHLLHGEETYRCYRKRISEKIFSFFVNK